MRTVDLRARSSSQSRHVVSVPVGSRSATIASVSGRRRPRRLAEPFAIPGAAALHSSAVTWSPQVALLPSSSTSSTRVRHEAIGGGAEPVLLAGLEEDAVPRPDHLVRPAAALAQAHALGDVNLRDGKVASAGVLSHGAGGSRSRGAAGAGGARRRGVSMGPGGVRDLTVPARAGGQTPPLCPPLTKGSTCCPPTHKSSVRPPSMTRTRFAASLSWTVGHRLSVRC